MRVAVIDYGIGNVQSVVNACAAVGADTARVADGAALDDFAPERIVLPGVGAIGAALARFRERGFVEPVECRVRDGMPFLGICVGMQMMAEICEEFGRFEGFGWIPGRVARLEGPPDLRIPHAGWNTIDVADPADPVLGPMNGRDAYFVHSYAIACCDAHVAARTTYGAAFVSAVRRGNIVGVQFHPEKSSADGRRLLARFLA